MSGSRVEEIGALARDARQHDTEVVSVREWMTGRRTITNAAWVLLDFLGRRNHFILQAPSTNPSTIILSHSNLATEASNDTTSDLCGLELIAGSSMPMSMTKNLRVYARVKASGGDCKLVFAESF